MRRIGIRYIRHINWNLSFTEVIEGPTNDGENSQQEDVNEHQAPIQRPEIVKRYDKLNLDQSKREEIGRKTKRILDFARCQFIKERIGLKSVALKYYTSTDISLENVVMIAHNWFGSVIT